MNKYPKNCQIILLLSFFTTRGLLTLKLWALLNLAHQDASFGTMKSQTEHIVMEVLTAGKIPEKEE